MGNRNRTAVQQRPGFYLAAARVDPHQVAVAHAQLLRVLQADLHQRLGVDGQQALGPPRLLRTNRTLLAVTALTTLAYAVNWFVIYPLLV